MKDGNDRFGGSTTNWLAFKNPQIPGNPVNSPKA